MCHYCAVRDSESGRQSDGTSKMQGTTPRQPTNQRQERNSIETDLEIWQRKEKKRFKRKKGLWERMQADYVSFGNMTGDASTVSVGWDFFSILAKVW